MKLYPNDLIFCKCSEHHWCISEITMEIALDYFEVMVVCAKECQPNHGCRVYPKHGDKVMLIGNSKEGNK